MNIYNANSAWTCWYDMQAGSTLDESLADIGPGQEVIRAWFFQRLAMRDGVRDWTAFDRTLATARAHGQRVVVTLGNQWGDCENASGSPVYKSEAWYRSGYRDAIDPGALVSYRDWVREIVARYRGDPVVLAWQLLNEAEALTAAGGSCGSTAEASVQAWASDVSALVKSIDPNHLVSLGTIGSGQCGTSTNQSYERLHALPTIDLCEYHDYDQPAPLPGDAWNGLAVRLAQCLAMDKPMFVGELGLKSGDVGGLNARAAVIEAKLEAQFAAGVAGVLLWDWRTGEHGGSTGGGYEFGPDDPALALLPRF
jgi:endo-1,4-beta-mannosidase